MIPILLALASVTPHVAVAATHGANKPVAATAQKKAQKQANSAPKKPAQKIPDPQASADATRMIDWIASSHNNAGYPYAIVDKKAAAIFLFDAKGKALGSAPVLIGIATGDDATPGIGAKNLAEIGPAEKTTPAGRFLAKFGWAAGKQRILWVDYATSVALHTIPPGNPKERRVERMLSPTSEDNRITFGCINLPRAFYGTKLRPIFQKKGGYVYVMPDTKSLEEVFPPIRVQPFLNASAS
jgi:hypothetical protein